MLSILFERRFTRACAALATCAALVSPPLLSAQSAAGTPGKTPGGNSAADVHFMQGMIPHHAQAVLIAGWAKSHGARSDVLALCERIVVGQRDEIHLMQFWLREHGESVPDSNATHMRMNMNGMQHDMLMPGMLTEDQLKKLDAARGSDFDRLFLEAMIGHHQGAISMVEELLASPGAANDDLVYRMSSDVYADQTTEIERMTKMLETVPPPAR